MVVATVSSAVSQSVQRKLDLFMTIIFIEWGIATAKISRRERGSELPLPA
jgi:hypothetical protein